MKNRLKTAFNLDPGPGLPRRRRAPGRRQRPRPGRAGPLPVPVLGHVAPGSLTRWSRARRAPTRGIDGVVLFHRRPKAARRTRPWSRSRAARSPPATSATSRAPSSASRRPWASSSPWRSPPATCAPRPSAPASTTRTSGSATTRSCRSGPSASSSTGKELRGPAARVDVPGGAAGAAGPGQAGRLRSPHRPLTRRTRRTSLAVAAHPAPPSLVIPAPCRRTRTPTFTSFPRKRESRGGAGATLSPHLRSSEEHPRKAPGTPAATKKLRSSGVKRSSSPLITQASNVSVPILLKPFMLYRFRGQSLGPDHIVQTWCHLLLRG